MIPKLPKVEPYFTFNKSNFKGLKLKPKSFDQIQKCSCLGHLKFKEYLFEVY